ncbi:serine--tRNA ligase [Paenibacillus senegalensis]|uniref:serine--tRNA ligase n=1 Tax=Paenibacillus senegalensis TaxID=1465766 RepID=UPI00028A3188|nr:serine--tRNA ligase [Paenibacillus senegalensis]
MLDIRQIREHAEQLQKVANRKGITISIESLLTLEQERLACLKECEQLRAQRNRWTEELKHSQGGDTGSLAQEVNRIRAQVRELNEKLRPLEAARQRLDSRCKELMLLVPNLVSADTPDGSSDHDNVELRRVGAVPSFAFPAKDHVELGSSLKLFDLPKGVAAAGSRGYYLTGAGVYLHRAVQQLAIDLLVSKGFTLLEVPLLVRESALIHTGFFPEGKSQTYSIEGEDHWLIGTAEVPLVSYHSGDWLDVSSPICLAAASVCFRKEAGSAGRDVRGLYRVHQFSKVEQVVICRADLSVSEEMHEKITAHAEELLQLLELPYRVVQVCVGDMSAKNYKQYDIETWMPSREQYGETHSSSQLLDYQARRSNLRYKDEHGKTRYCYTLNNTAVASPRILIPLLENHQREDGSVYIPEALRPYLYEWTEIR